MAKKKKKKGFRPVVFKCSHHNDYFDENLKEFLPLLKKGVKVGLEIPEEGIEVYRRIAADTLLADSPARYTAELVKWNTAYRMKLFKNIAPEIPFFEARQHVMNDVQLNINSHLFWYRLYKRLKSEGIEVHALMPHKAWTRAAALGVWLTKYQRKGEEGKVQKILGRYINAIGPEADDKMAEKIVNQKVGVNVLGASHSVGIRPFLKRLNARPRIVNGYIIDEGKTPFDEKIREARPRWIKRKKRVLDRLSSRQKRKGKK